MLDISFWQRLYMGQIINPEEAKIHDINFHKTKEEKACIGS